MIDGAPVTVEINEGSKSYIFRATDGFKFVLLKSQITNVRRENNDVIEVIEKPSIGHAALGYIGFGIPGLLLGSLATKQQERILQMDRALVFDYIDSCGVAAQIRCGYLDDKGCNFDWWTISSFEKDYSKHRNEYAH